MSSENSPMPDRDTVSYAIGDVHGEADRLRQLHGLIRERHAFSHPESACRIIHLGDYVDRGPDSYGVIETIRALETSDWCEVISLRGNHEQLMLSGLADPRGPDHEVWMANGGDATLDSYFKADLVTVPASHRRWMARCPAIYSDPQSRTHFVHAGVDVRTFPDCREEVYLWTRSPAFFDAASWDNPALDGWRVVHGHTPTDDYHPDIEGDPPRRINLDTGAVFGGRLTCAILPPDGSVGFIYA